MRRSMASRRLSWPSTRFSQSGVLASSRSASQTLAPEFNALIVILRSVGPVISARRSTRPGAASATRQLSSSRTCLGLVEEVEQPTGGQLGVALLAQLQQLLAPAVEATVQVGQEGECLGREHLVVPVPHRSVDPDVGVSHAAPSGCALILAGSAVNARAASSRSSGVARAIASAGSGSRSSSAWVATTPRSTRRARSAASRSTRPARTTHRHTCGPGPPGDADRGLPGQRLVVDGALAGDHQVGADERVVEADEVEHQVDARGQPGAEERQRAGAGAAGGSGARRRVSTSMPWSRRSSCASRERPASSTVDVRGGRALLRTVDSGRSRRAGERVVDVAGDDHLGRRDPRVQAGEVDARQVD